MIKDLDILLTQFQTNVLREFIKEFTELKVTNYKISGTVDDELLIWKRTDEALTNIIINPDELIAFSVIHERSSRSEDILLFKEWTDIKEVAIKFKNTK